MYQEFDPALSRAIAYEALEAKRKAADLEFGAKPFDFADLKGRPEPEKWGPKYSKPSKPGPAIDRFPSNCASGQKYDFCAEKHRAKMRAEFQAQCAADRRNWALGKAKDSRGRTIKQAYAAAMAAKRAREAS